MKKITILLPDGNTRAHLEAICESANFDVDLDNWQEFHPRTVVPKYVRLKQSQSKKKSKNANTPIGCFLVLPARDNSIIMFVPTPGSEAVFEDIVNLVINHFKEINFLAETRAEPWRKSSPKNKERDKTIWESRNSGETWERTAELANCGISTTKEKFLEMQRRLDDD